MELHSSFGRPLRVHYFHIWDPIPDSPQEGNVGESNPKYTYYVLFRPASRMSTAIIMVCEEHLNPIHLFR